MSAGEPAECHRSPIRIASFAPTMSPRRLTMSSILECSSCEVPTRRHRSLVLPDFVENDQKIRVPSTLNPRLAFDELAGMRPCWFLNGRCVAPLPLAMAPLPSTLSARAHRARALVSASEIPIAALRQRRTYGATENCGAPARPALNAAVAVGNSIIARHVSPSSTTPTSRWPASSGQGRTASMRRRVVTSPSEVARRSWLRGSGGPRVNGTPDRLPATRSICMVAARPTQTLCHRQ